MNLLIIWGFFEQGENVCSTSEMYRINTCVALHPDFNSVHVK